MKQVKLNPVQADDTIRQALFVASNMLMNGANQDEAVRAAESVAKAALSAANLIYSHELTESP